MKKYMEFIEKYSLEKRFYCRLYDVYKKNEWEISWKRIEGGERSWAFKSIDDSSWLYYSSEELIKVLNHQKIDIFRFEAEMQSKIKNMIVFASLMHKEARKLMGQDIVESSLAEYDEFASALMDTINQLLPDVKSNPNMGVKDGVFSEGKEPTLKLITNPASK